MPLSSEQRKLRAQVAAHALHSQYDSRDLVANATAASPASALYWEGQVDPDNLLDPAERKRRAEHLKKQHYHTLALASAKARRRSADDKAMAAAAADLVERTRAAQGLPRTVSDLAVLKRVAALIGNPQ